MSDSAPQVAIATPGEFKFLKTVRLGTGVNTAYGLRKAIEAKNMRVGNLTDDALKTHFKAATREREIEVDLESISIEELGFGKDGAKIEDVFAQGKKRGRELCVKEVGPRLREEYAEQPSRESLIIAMDDLMEDGYLTLFCVENTSHLWLSSYFLLPSAILPGHYRFVFTRPRKKAL